MTRQRVLVTGCTGFVGAALLRRLVLQPELEVLGWVRRSDALLPVGVVPVPASRERLFAAGAAPEKLDVLIHCAGRAHVLQERSADPLEKYRQVNLGLTVELAREAARLGARRFVFVSTIKVNGEQTSVKPFTAWDVAAPVDPYALSKLEAEQALGALAAETGMEIVIVRPPLIYGPGVKANFLSLFRAVQRGWPLPLGGVRNRRSLVALDNLVDLLVTCMNHPAAANQVLLVSDGEPMSTPELLRGIGKALGRPARLVAVPPGWLKAGARLVRRPAMYERLCGSLEVDDAATRQLLHWRPPVSVDQALAATARWFLGERRL
jgi:nucleoside-diphosphate-sugar epimerase